MLGTTLVLGCSNETAPPEPVAKVTVSPATAIVVVGGFGGTVQLTATTTNAAGNVLKGRTLTWASSNTAVATVAGTGLVTGVAPGSATITATSEGQAGTAGITVSPTPPPAQHRIALRMVSGATELYDWVTGVKFTPRGNNYTRLAMLQKIYGGNLELSHSTFIPGYYDSVQTELALAGMETLKYNVVRVLLNGADVGGLADPGGGLSSAYVANVADFIKRAKVHGIFVVVSLEFIPDGPPYSDLLNAQQGALFQQINLYFLTAGGVSAVSLFWTDFIHALAAAGAPLGAILAYQLHEEQYFDGSAPPLSLTAGTVTTGNGQSYDMADAVAKRRMMDENLVYYVNHVRPAILAVDPTALVTIGFFWPQGPNPARIGDPRITNPYPAIAGSTIDFVNLSVYPEVDGLTLAQLVQNFAFAGYLEKPVVMGEFGAYKAYHATEQSAVQALTTWQVQSCSYGFTGWLLWTWDTFEQPEWWNARAGSGLIGDMLSPARRPDPCFQ